MTVAGRYIDKFIMVLIAGAGLLQLTDYSMTYYTLHSKPYFYEMGLVGSWALSHGSIGWYLMGLFDFLDASVAECCGCLMVPPIQNATVAPGCLCLPLCL